ncbi:MAG: hypothetical protein WBB45_00080 [Cyclobacteriaceae bacterium]
MDLSKLRFLRRAVAFLSFSIALLALVNFAYRTKPDKENLTVITGTYDNLDNLPSGEIVLELADHDGMVYIKSNLSEHFDSTAFAKEVTEGTTLYMEVEKEGVREAGTYIGNVLSLRTKSSEYLPLKYAEELYADAVNGARRGFIQFFILTLVLLVPEMARRRRIPEDSTDPSATPLAF